MNQNTRGDECHLPSLLVDLDPVHSLLLDVGSTLRQQETLRCCQDSLVLLSSSSTVLLSFAPENSLSAYNSNFSSFSQSCPLQYLLVLSTIVYCTKAIALCSSFAPQEDMCFSSFMVVEHGSLQWQSCTYPQHVPPQLVALSHFSPCISLSQAQQTKAHPGLVLLEEQREQSDKVATTRCSSLHQRPGCWIQALQLQVLATPSSHPTRKGQAAASHICWRDDNLAALLRAGQSRC